MGVADSHPWRFWAISHGEVGSITEKVFMLYCDLFESGILD